MTKHFRSRYPRYPDDSDYKTNASSYYDDLARKNKLIEILAEKIYGYEKVLAENLAEIERVLNAVIDKIGEGFNEEIVTLLKIWVQDGTLDHIINETLMNKKADKTELEALDIELTNRISAIKQQVETELGDFRELFNEDLTAFKEGLNQDILELVTIVEVVDSQLETDFNTPPLHSGIDYEKKYDTQTQTHYVLTRIPMKDSVTGEQKQLKLHADYNNYQTGEDFLKGKKISFLSNAGMSTENQGNIDFITIKDKQIISSVPSSKKSRHTLGIKEDGTLKSYPPSSTAQQLLNDGVVNAITAFSPLIENGNYNWGNINYSDGNKEQHPRQIIGQLPNKDLIYLTTSGRGVGGYGMSYERCANILMNEGVRFAYALDGGGSNQTYVRGLMVNDNTNRNPNTNEGEFLRPRESFLYIEDNEPMKEKSKTIHELTQDIQFLKRELDIVKGFTGVKWYPELLIRAERSPNIIYGERYGHVAKVGGMVFAYFYMEINDIGEIPEGSAVPSIQISGLNQRQDRNVNQSRGGIVHITNLLPETKAGQVYLTVDPGVRYARVRYIHFDTGAETVLKTNNLQSSFVISGMFPIMNAFQDIIGAE